MTITRINDFYAASGREGALREFLQSVISVIKDAPGCLDAELLVESENATHLVIVEKWQDVAAHQAAANLIPPGKLAQVQTLLAAPPKGIYYERT